MSLDEAIVKVDESIMDVPGAVNQAKLVESLEGVSEVLKQFSVEMKAIVDAHRSITGTMIPYPPTGAVVTRQAPTTATKTPTSKVASGTRSPVPRAPFTLPSTASTSASTSVTTRGSPSTSLSVSKVDEGIL